MKIQQKFFMLAGIVGCLMAIVSFIGYYTANANLQASVEAEISAVLESEKNEISGWLQAKSAPALSAADLLSAHGGDITAFDQKQMLSLAAHDKEVMELAYGTVENTGFAHNAGSLTGLVNIPERPWFKEARDTNGLVFTEVYQDSITKTLIVSAAAPFVDSNKAFRGAICEDISIDVLKEKVKDLKYRGEGTGIILDKAGTVIATTGTAEPMSDVKDTPYGAPFKDMVANGKGYTTIVDNGEDMVLAYATVPETGWVLGVSIPESIVFASVNSMRMIYLILTVIGVAITVVSCLQFARNIVTPVVELDAHALKLAQGNLKIEDIPVSSSDEIGNLIGSFNTMKANLRNLIGTMASICDQVAAASEELTANANQSADASIHVAENVGDVAFSMESQMHSVETAKVNVEGVVEDIKSMLTKSSDVVRASADTAKAADDGGSLMQNAVTKMGNIESSVMSSADVVRKLGENSTQIGVIVDAISAIAEQTNLLALNAAIEAARAGEHGRGFAVVAEEVRKLAEQSQEAAEEIRQRIADIQKETAQAVAAMEVGTKNVTDGTDAIREVGAQFNDILNMVTGIRQQMEGINASVTTVSGGAGKIVAAVDEINGVSVKTLNAIQDISGATEEQSASNEEIAAAAQSLAKLAADMQAAVGRFKI